MVKNPPVNEGNTRDVGLTPGLGRSSLGGNGNPTPIFLPGESHRQRSLASYSPQCHKESETTEHTHRHTKERLVEQILLRILLWQTVCIAWLS